MSVHFLGKGKSYYVYALLCQDHGGPGYVKFGRTGDIAHRLTSVRTACPIPVKYIATAKVLNYEASKRVEREFHKKFEPRKITGEWYRFDFADKEDKKAFNDGSREIFLKNTGPTMKMIWWEQVKVSALDALAKERRDNYLRYRRKGDLKASNYAAERARMAQKELSIYGIKS